MKDLKIINKFIEIYFDDGSNQGFGLFLRTKIYSYNKLIKVKDEFLKGYCGYNAISENEISIKNIEIKIK